MQWYIPADAWIETVFSPAHAMHDRILYDRRAGQYYDRYQDMYISLDEAKAYGLPV